MMDAEKMNKEVEETYSEVKKMFDRAVDSMKSQRDIVLSIVVENGVLRQRIDRLKESKQETELPNCLGAYEDNDLDCSLCKFSECCMAYVDVEKENCRMSTELEKKDKVIDDLIKRSADLASRLHKAEMEIKTLKEGAAKGDKPKFFGDSEINDKCCYCDVFIECAILSGVKHGKP